MDQQINDLIADFIQEQDIVKRAQIVKTLAQEYKVPLVHIAKQTGLKASHISHILRINRLSPLIIDGYYAESISATHLFSIARLKDPQKEIELFETILTNNLSVGATEILVREQRNNIKDTGTHLDKKEIETFTEKMRERNLDTTVIQTRTKAKIVFEVQGNLEHTSQVLRKFMKDQETVVETKIEVLSVADL